MKNQVIAKVNNYKHIGVILETNCNWHKQIEMLTS